VKCFALTVTASKAQSKKKTINSRSELLTLSVYRQAIARLPLLGIQVLLLTHPEVETATRLSQQYELLTGDAVIVAVMRQHGLTSLASLDDDFDRVPGLTRYAPV
jgi:predicted nucleic acid-binding protein